MTPPTAVTSRPLMSRECIYVASNHTPTLHTRHLVRCKPAGKDEDRLITDPRLLIYDEVLPRLIGIEREWRAYGKLGTDVLIALASLRSQLSPERDCPTCQRLCYSAKTRCALYVTTYLYRTYTDKAEAVGKRIHHGGGAVGADVGGGEALFYALVPVVYLLRNLRHRRVQRPYAVVHRHPVDNSWRLKTVTRS